MMNEQFACRAAVKHGAATNGNRRNPGSISSPRPKL
jgi:hypothetical protein